MRLIPEQTEQLRKQLEGHKHKPYETDIQLALGIELKSFWVNQRVYRPDLMCTAYVAQWLFYSNSKYFGKEVIDMGCGSGLMGIVMGLFGANHVTSGDISDEAVENTLINVKRYSLDSKITVVKSDLFRNIKNKADVVLFNHPFFPDEPIPEEPVSYSMLGGEELIHKFLEEVKNHINANGIVVMPYFHLAGETNNPAIQGPKHGFKVTEVFKTNLKSGFQQGSFSIYELKR